MTGRRVCGRMNGWSSNGGSRFDDSSISHQLASKPWLKSGVNYQTLPLAAQISCTFSTTSFSSVQYLWGAFHSWQKIVSGGASGVNSKSCLLDPPRSVLAVIYLPSVQLAEPTKPLTAARALFLVCSIPQRTQQPSPTSVFSASALQGSPLRRQCIRGKSPHVLRSKSSIFQCISGFEERCNIVFGSAEATCNG